MPEPTELIRLIAVIVFSVCICGSQVSGAEDYRDADRNWFAKIEDSGPAGLHNEQPAIVIADNGDWICAWTTGPKEAGADLFVTSSISSDRGRTWSRHRAIEPLSGPRVSAYSYLWKHPDGRIFCFYRWNSTGTWKPRIDLAGDFYFRVSTDHGRSWSKRYKIPTRRTAIDYRDVPCAWLYGQGPVVHRGHFIIPGTKKGADGRRAHFWVSPNLLTAGNYPDIVWHTWPEGDTQGIVMADGHMHSEEPVLITLPNGNLYATVRTNVTGYLGQSLSTDGGRSWSDGVPAKYATGHHLAQPKAGTAILMLDDDEFLLTFNNDRANGDPRYADVPWWELMDRSPLWLTVGRIAGNAVHYVQPEILVFNDEDTTTSAEGNRSSIHGMYLFKDGSNVFGVYSNKKTDIQLMKIPQKLIDGLRNQETLKEIPNAAVAFRWQAGTPQPETLRLPDIGKRQSISIALRWRQRSDRPGQTLLDARHVDGTGLWIGTARKDRVEVRLTDSHGRTTATRTASYADTRDRSLGVIVDGSAKVICLLGEGRLMNAASRMPFADMDRRMVDCGGPGRVAWGKPSRPGTVERGLDGEIQTGCVWNRALTTSEMIGALSSITDEP